MKRIDAKTPGQKSPEMDIGRQAEEALVAALELIPGLRARHGTPEEDSGREQIVKDPVIDVVGYLGDRPAFVVQVTTAVDSVVRAEKIRQFMARPLFPRIEGVAVPRTLVFLEPSSVRAYQADRDISKHPAIRTKMLDDMMAMLGFARGKTKLPNEIASIDALVGALKAHRASV